MDCSTPGFPVHHQPLKFAQTRVHQVGDAIQPSHPSVLTAYILYSANRLKNILAHSRHSAFQGKIELKYHKVCTYFQKQIALSFFWVIEV